MTEVEFDTEPSLVSSYFCEFRLHVKFQLAKLCRSWISKKVLPNPCLPGLQTDDRYLSVVVALVPAGNQIKFDWG